MFFLTVKKEIENLDDESSIYVPSLVITFDIQIETTDIENKFATVRIEKIEPSNLENITLIEYIAKELEEKLKEDIEKNIRKSLYIENQEYYSLHLKVIEEIDTLIIDRKDVVFVDSKYRVLVSKNTPNIPSSIRKGIHTFNLYMPFTIKEAIQKLISLS
jgi:biotin-(acetyl-CoA carboxylase) ligase